MRLVLLSLLTLLVMTKSVLFRVIQAFKHLFRVVTVSFERVLFPLTLQTLRPPHRMEIDLSCFGELYTHVVDVIL